MANIQTKRILHDYKLVKKNNLEESNIFIKPNENNIENVKALIIGPENTPYEKGFYFFDITFPKNYPYSPPKVIFCTHSPYNDVRFNPNLYTNGKVCLSILGTWSGPGWTSCINLPQILLSIQSLLNENPLQNEPGFELEIGEKSINYKKLINYYNVLYATLHKLDEIPVGFEYFKNIIEEKFKENIDFYDDFIEKNKEFDNKIIKSTIYSMTGKIDLSKISSKLLELKQRFNLIQKKKMSQ